MKKVIFFLAFAFIVAGILPAGAQEVSSPKELVIEKQELMNALRQISDAVWDMEEQKVRPRVEEQALQYRLDRLEKMILDLSLYLGLRPTGVGQNSIASTECVMWPLPITTRSSLVRPEFKES